jgi:hypothetical protein
MVSIVTGEGLKVIQQAFYWEPLKEQLCSCDPALPHEAPGLTGLKRRYT